MLQTVNVVVLYDGVLCSIVSFPDTPEGNELANTNFVKVILNLKPDWSQKLAMQDPFALPRFTCGKFFVRIARSIDEKDQLNM